MADTKTIWRSVQWFVLNMIVAFAVIVSANRVYSFSGFLYGTLALYLMSVIGFVLARDADEGLGEWLFYSGGSFTAIYATMNGLMIVLWGGQTLSALQFALAFTLAFIPGMVVSGLIAFVVRERVDGDGLY